MGSLLTDCSAIFQDNKTVKKERITKDDVLILDSVSTLYDKEVITWLMEEKTKFICLSLPFSVENRMIKKIPMPFEQAVCRLILARFSHELLVWKYDRHPRGVPGILKVGKMVWGIGKTVYKNLIFHIFSIIQKLYVQFYEPFIGIFTTWYSLDLLCFLVDDGLFCL